MLITLIAFLFCAAAIFFAGMRLSYYGDIIAEKTGLGKAWIGLTLMAAVTSLPELSVGISSVRIVDSADLAVGDVLGSCVFNLAILSLLDAINPRIPLLGKAVPGHTLGGAFGIVLLSLVGLGLILDNLPMIFNFISLVSLISMSTYFFSVRLLFRYERRNQSSVAFTPTARAASKEDITLNKAMKMYAILAVIVVGAALALPYFAERIAMESGLSQSFVGTLFLAAATSLPEIAVSIGALRLELTSIAIGNLIGSNLFNMLILSLDDIFYEGNLLQDASESHIISVFSVLIMTAIAIIGFVYSSQSKRFILAWDTLLILIIYIINMIILYSLK